MSRGMTLWELMLTIAIVATVAGLGAPSLREFNLDARRTAAINAFVGAVQLARSEAAKRARSVIVCASADRITCAGDGRSYAAGWMVFVNEDDRLPPARSGTEPLLAAHAPALAGSIVSNRVFYEFRAYRRRSTNGTIVFCDARGRRAARAVIVSYTGRPRVASAGSGDGPLDCALLP